MMQVFWSNDLVMMARQLAEYIDSECAAEPRGVFAKRHCVLLPNRALQLWFQHYFLYDYRGASGLRVLANCSFFPVYEFINDWLYWMQHPNDKRDATAHPFSKGALQWRIYRLLCDGNEMSSPDFKPLRDYISAAGPDARPRRAFGLAGRLATLFDEYQVYRPDMLSDWHSSSSGRSPAAAPNWQPRLWRLLVSGMEDQTYLHSFVNMDRLLPKCRVADKYHAIHVFGISMMPQAYAEFFRLLPAEANLKLYLFNPCQAEWDGLLKPREFERLRAELRLQGIEDDAAMLDCGNPFLANMGRGSRNFLATIMDATGGQIKDVFADSPAETALAQLQQAVLDNQEPPEKPCVATTGSDTIRIHSCHSPVRELEVLRDQIYGWFEEDPDLQPRHIQVLVPNMADYAPQIDAVFFADNPESSEAIPYAIADRRSAGENSAFEAFVQLLSMAESRFTAREVMDLLQFEGIHRCFGMSEREVAVAAKLISGSGIRWGIDAEHRKALTAAEFGVQTTWARGLDRLLVGYAMTDQFEPGGDYPLPCDMVEDDSADTLGKLARFFDELQTLARELKRDRTPEAWSKYMRGVIDRFFARTEDTYVYVGALYRATDKVAWISASAAYDDPVPIAIVRDFFAAIHTAAAGDNINGNKVLFGELRAGAPAPRPIICLLGLGDRQFPRSGNRPAYDVLRAGSRFGDPSPKTEDRAAFLEAFMAARQRLHLSYVGQSIEENETIPPSTVLAELQEYAGIYLGAEAVKTIEHKLHAFNPEYFKGKGSMYFSYDADNLQAAQVVAGQGDSQQEQSAAVATGAVHDLVELDDLIRFFRNPAKAFFHNTLQARLDDDGDGPLAEDEEFDPKGFAAWKINTEIIDAMVAGHELADVHYELLERGLLPLGEWGKAWFEELWDGVAADLEKSPVEGEPSVLDLLKGTAPLADHPLRIGVGRYTLSGMVAGLRDEGGNYRVGLDYRYATPKFRDDLSCWIRHLFTCANGYAGRRISMQDKRSAKKPSTTQFHICGEDTARRRLAELLDIYERGSREILPFCPESSHACAKSAAAGDIDPLAKARSEWFSSDYATKEDKDVYYLSAFGPEGPFEHDSFADLAEMVFGPMLENIENGGGCDA